MTIRHEDGSKLGAAGPSEPMASVHSEPHAGVVGETAQRSGATPDRVEADDDDPRIVASPLETIKYIQSLLADVYTDAGDGRTIVRELVQNADDARARRAKFVVLEAGWPDAHNPLLHGPGLLVVNDGPFRAEDRRGLHRSLGGSKGGDAAKVGRFGVGMKSVFHLAEAFLYVGAEGGRVRGGALNPWAGTGDKEKKTDPVNPSWDTLREGDDQACLERAGATLLGGFNDGFVLWVPFRQPEHLNRDGRGSFALSGGRPTPKAVRRWFARTDALALLIAQCGSLRAVEAASAVGPEALATRACLARVERPNEDGSWVGRPEDDGTEMRRPFEGQVALTDGQGREELLPVVGMETCGHPELRAMRAAPDWPDDSDWVDGRLVYFKRKALAHAAITVVRHRRRGEQARLRLRWAVFLPLDDDPSPSSDSRVVETIEIARGAEQGAEYDWEILLHGYFGPSQDRRSIPGVTPTDQTNPEEIRVRWNQAVRDRLLLPRLPEALLAELRRLEPRAAEAFARAVQQSSLLRAHAGAVTSEQALVARAVAEGVSWSVVPAEAPLHIVPRWQRAPEAVRRAFAEAAGVEPHRVFVDAEAPRLSREPQQWPEAWLRKLLDTADGSSFSRPAELRWWAELAGTTVAGAGEGAVAELQQWLQRVIADGALRPAERSKEQEIRDLLRSAWRRLFEALPRSDWIEAPLEALPAAEEHAKDGGLLVLPLGMGSDEVLQPPSVEDVDQALRGVGRRLADAPTKPRLALAEALLRARPARRFPDDLLHVPLLRATRFPDETDEAWSLRDLDDDERVVLQAGKVRDPRVASRQLAAALGTPVWLIGRAPAGRGLPEPDLDGLAGAVGRARRLAEDPEARRGLLDRFAAEEDGLLAVEEMRALLVGRRVATGTSLLFDEEGGDAKARAQAADRLLDLLGDPPRVPSTLLANLPRKWLHELSLHPVDGHALHELVVRANAAGVAWSRLGEKDAVHLLRTLHDPDPDRRRAWWAMGLHRTASGDRVAVPESSQVARAGREAVELPEGLIEELIVLAPDEALEPCYQDVEPLEGEHILLKALNASSPWRFATYIAEAVRDRGGSTARKVDQALRSSAWLPTPDGRGVAPEHVLPLPEEVARAAERYAQAGLLGAYRLEDQVSVPDGVNLRRILGGRGRPEQIRRLAEALDIRSTKGGADASLLALPSSIDEAKLREWVEWGLDTQLARENPAWRLLRKARNAMDRSNEGLDEEQHRALTALASALCGPMSSEELTRRLLPLCRVRPRRGSSDWKLFHALCLDRLSRRELRPSVLMHLWLPTRDGSWHPATEVAAASYGLAPRHTADGPLADKLRSRLETTAGSPNNADRPGEATATAADLEKYVDGWRDSVSPAVAGAFLFVLSEAGIKGLARSVESRMGRETPLEVHRMELGLRPLENTNVALFLQPVSNGRVRAENLVGEWVDMEAAVDHDNLFATEPQPKTFYIQTHWNLTLRDVPAHALEAGAREAMVAATVDWLLVRILGVDPNKAKTWWTKWAQGSQVDVAPVRASIQASLPLTLRQLDVSRHQPLSQALKQAESAQRYREQVAYVAPASLDAIRRSGKADHRERVALQKLSGMLVEDDGVRRFVIDQVRSKIRSFGYQASSVLLELTQNADDALAQAAEIAASTGRAYPPEAGRVLVRVSDTSDGISLDFVHYGRPINDTGGAGFPAGADRQWDQDLYFMMLMNLSAKPGEDPRNPGVHSTTGRFGLGFKSVHLVSDRPQVASGFIGFDIEGGLLPVQRTVTDIEDRPPTVAGHRPTLVRLPLVERRLLGDVFARFDLARPLVPVFARQIREIIVEGGPNPGTSRVDFVAVAGADGWEVSRDELEIPKLGWVHLLRFRPPNDAESLALVIAVKDGLPVPLPREIPFLWNTLPTSEGWACGYALNGPFKLDPGRTHVALDNEDTLAAVSRLGEALAEGLVGLHDLVAIGAPEFVGDADRFMADLWDLLMHGLDVEDTLRRRFLQTLHAEERGVLGWMAQRSVVPSGLPPPFAPLLPELRPGHEVVPVEVREFDETVCKHLAEIPSIAAELSQMSAISAERYIRVRRVVKARDQRLSVADVVDAQLQARSFQLPPEAVLELAPLAVAEVRMRLVGALARVRWHRTEVLGRDGRYHPIRQVVLDVGLDDEAGLIAPFAPANALLSEDYEELECPVELLTLIQGASGIGAKQLLEWATQAETQSARKAVLEYLERGQYKDELNSLLESERPNWMESEDAVRGMLKSTSLGQGAQAATLARLIPKTTEPRVESKPSDSATVRRLEPAQQKRFLENLKNWWDNEHEREQHIRRAEEEIWPDFLLRDLRRQLEVDSDDHWLGLFVLGACWSFGRTKPGQHRTFLEFLEQSGWWPTLTRPLEKEAWMGILDDWFGSAAQDLERRAWMSLFPSIYQMSRNIEGYRRLFLTAGRRNEGSIRSLSLLLRPRVDPALFGAGQAFDVAPMPLGIGAHWVLRELLRLGVVEGHHLYRLAWLPSKSVIEFLEPLGLEGNTDETNEERSRAIHGLLQKELGDACDLHRCFDLPLRVVASDERLQQELGYES